MAVSGGPDSVALLRGLEQLQPEFGWELAVGHFDHRWRGTESAADADWVRDLAGSLKLPCCIAASEAATLDEASARLQRYTFLERAATQFRCSAIATGHTADDQAETVLHHFLRGTGLAGLRGIPWEREVGSRRSEEMTIVRPLLAITRTQVLAFLKELGQDFRVDRTNAESKLTRNWLRRSIMPELQQRWPQLTQSLCRLAEQAEELQTAFSQLASDLLDRAVVDAGAQVVRLDVTALADRPRHLVRQAFVELWHRRGWPLQEMGYEQWSRLADLVQSDDMCTFPGAIEARRRGRLLVIQRANG